MREEQAPPLRGTAATNLASLREGGGTALARVFSPLVFTPSRSRDGGSLRVMELYLEFYRVLNITQPLYNPIFLQDLILTMLLLDCPMAPSVTFGDSSLPEGAEEDRLRMSSLGRLSYCTVLPEMYAGFFADAVQ